MSDGRTAYLGPAKQAVQHFEGLGFPCPTHHNPPDHFLSVLSVRPESRDSSIAQRDAILDAYAASDAGKLTMDEVAEHSSGSSGVAAAGVTLHSRKRVPISREFTQLLVRSIRVVARDVSLLRARLVQTVFLAFFAGILYWQIEQNQRGIQNRSGAIFFIIINQSFTGIFGVVNTFVAELQVFLREKRSGMYSALLYFISRSCSDLLMQVFFPIMFCSLVYPMVGFHDDWMRFFSFCFIIVLTSNAAMSLGYLISTAAPSVDVALAMGPLVLLPFLLLGGFFVNTETIPVWLSWIKHISFFTYGYEAAMVNEFDGTSIRCDPDETEFPACRAFGNATVTHTAGDDVLTQFGMSSDDFWFDICILGVLLVGFRFLSYVILEVKTRILLR